MLFMDIIDSKSPMKDLRKSIKSDVKSDKDIGDDDSDSDGDGSCSVFGIKGMCASQKKLKKKLEKLLCREGSDESCEFYQGFLEPFVNVADIISAKPEACLGDFLGQHC